MLNKSTQSKAKSCPLSRKNLSFSRMKCQIFDQSYGILAPRFQRVTTKLTTILVPLLYLRTLQTSKPEGATPSSRKWKQPLNSDLKTRNRKWQIYGSLFSGRNATFNPNSGVISLHRLRLLSQSTKRET